MSFKNSITQDFVFILNKSLCNHFGLKDNENKINLLISNTLDLLNAEIISSSSVGHQQKQQQPQQQQQQKGMYFHQYMNHPEEDDYPYIHDTDDDDKRDKCPRSEGQDYCSFSECKVCN